MRHLPSPALVRAVLHWPTASQARARRNALAANTELARGRALREEVERYLKELSPPASDRVVSPLPRAPRRPPSPAGPRDAAS